MSDNKQNNKTKINILNRLQTKVNNTNAKVKLDLIGTVLLDKYTIHSKMNTVSGEAELYRCTDNNQNEYVVKIYQRENAIKPEIIEKLKSINSPNVAKIIDSGLYENYPFVILPYYSNGSLVEALLSKGMTFDLDDIKEFVLPSLNNGLKVLHDNGIIHKDLKPSNIMISDDGANLVIIDFGISSNTNGGTVVVTKTGMTPIYLAPEALSNTYLKETDYYALGITIYELFTGHTPYENLNEEQIASYASIQKIPFSDAFPEDLKNLISGLTYKDLSNRNDKNNPNRRWTFEEVQKWLKGEKQQIPNTALMANEKDYEFAIPFKLEDVFYRNSFDLGNALLSNWSKGQQDLGRGFLTHHFDLNNDAKLKKVCEKFENEFSQNNITDDQRDVIYFKTIYQLFPCVKKLYWKELQFNDLVDYGDSLIDEVVTNGSKNKVLIQTAQDFLKNGILTTYVSCSLKNNKIQELIENCQKLLTSKPIEEDMQALRLGYALTNREDFKIGNRSFKTIQEFNNYLDKLFETDIVSFSRYYKNNESDINKLRFILNDQRLTEFNKNLPNSKNDIILGDFEYCFRNSNELLTFEEKLYQDNKFLEFYDFTKFYQEKLQNYHNDPKFTTVKKQINDLVVLDECVFQSQTAFIDYLLKLKQCNQPFFRTYKEIHKVSLENYLKNLTDKKIIEALDKKLGIQKRIFEIFGQFVAPIKVGDIARFGNYYINNDKQKEPIEWKVLEISNDRALLITKDAIDCEPYDNERRDITWENCTLRQWLNNEFINQAFSKEEQNEILLTNISNPNNESYGTRGGNNTQDKIFLLSKDEAQKYFKNDEDGECKPTNYAKRQGAGTTIERGNSFWWFRSPCDGQSFYGHGFLSGRIAVRPALFINL